MQNYIWSKGVKEFLRPQGTTLKDVEDCLKHDNVFPFNIYIYIYIYECH